MTPDKQRQKVEAIHLSLGAIGVMVRAMDSMASDFRHMRSASGDRLLGQCTEGIDQVVHLLDEVMCFAGDWHNDGDSVTDTSLDDAFEAMGLAMGRIDRPEPAEGGGA